MAPRFRIADATPAVSTQPQQPAHTSRRSEAPRAIPLFLKSSVSTDRVSRPERMEPPPALYRGSLTNAALAREITLRQTWLERYPASINNSYVRSELDGLQAEQGARLTAKNPAVVKGPASPEMMERRILELRNASPNNAVYFQALKQEGLYEAFAASHMMGFSPFDKTYTLEQPDYYDAVADDDLQAPITMGRTASFNVNWTQRIIPMEGDQGDRSERVREASWTMTPAALNAYITNVGGGLTPFEAAMGVLAISRENATISPFFKDSVLLGYEMDWGGSGLKEHVLYSRDGLILANSTSEAALVKEGIGPLVLALPGVGLSSMARGVAGLGRGALSFARGAGSIAGDLAEASGLRGAFNRAVFKTRFVLGTAELGAANAADTAFIGQESADTVALVEMRETSSAADVFAGARPNAVSPAAPSAVTAPAAAPTPTLSVSDVLNADRSGFANAGALANASRLSQVQALALANLARGYLAYRPVKGAPRLSAEGWLRAQKTGQYRRDAVSLFGSNYARPQATPVGAASSGGVVSLSNIARPASYSDTRLQADLAILHSNAGTWARLSNFLASGPRNGQVSMGYLNILKGNIGEILARPAIDSRLAVLQRAVPSIRTEYDARIISRNGGSAKLAADVFLVSEANGELFVHEVAEVKAGSQGGQEATTQFFDWREGRLQDGDQLVLSNGNRYTYDPAGRGPGHVRGLLSSTPHIIAPRGSEALGLQSGDQVAAEGLRTALPQSADELTYLARVLIESLPPTP